jgi:hypothetical protein
MNMTGCSIADNNNVADGGAVFNKGKLSISNSTFVDNLGASFAGGILNLAALNVDWSGTSGNHLNPALGLADIMAEAAAVTSFNGALLPTSALPAATIENYQFNIALADRILAVVTNTKNKPAAANLIAQGDALSLAGNYTAAIADYALAWMLVHL